MPVITGERRQRILFPQSIEEYVHHDDAVRVYDAFIDGINLKEIEIQTPNDLGRPKYDPVMMLKLLLYSYSYGTRGSRQIERACYHNISYMWLTGGLKPDHKTIAEYRRQNKKVLSNILKQCVRFCIKNNLIEGNILFVDGSKIRANASINKSWTKETCLKKLAKIDNRIESLLSECESIDQAESDQGSYVKIKKELQNKTALKEKINQFFTETKNDDNKKKNMTDPECANMKGRQGIHASYNVQSVVDDKHGLIVHADPVSDATDINQFSNQIEQANEQLNKKCDVACSDAGYANTADLEKTHQQGIKVIVPSQKQALHNKPKPFHRDEFQYDSKNNQYICPQGQTLIYRGINEKKQEYTISKAKHCLTCIHFGVCTQSKNGRKVTRLIKAKIKEQLEAQYLEPESQEIYKRRKEKVELPFGHIKRNLRFNAFSLRGIQGAQAETSILATCFNLVRMATILGGVTPLIQHLKT